MTCSEETAVSKTTVRQDTRSQQAAIPTRLMPISATVVVQVKPGHEAEFLRLLNPVLDAMRREPTFINATLHRDPDDPTRFMIYETWADRQDLVEVQIPRAYRQAYFDRLPAILREERQITVWQPMRSDFAFAKDHERRQQ